MSDPFSLSGKKILVVGATSGIGQAITLRALQSGAMIVAVDESKELLEEMKLSMDSGELNIESFSIFSSELIEPYLQNLFTTFGPFNGFVFCAGIGGVRPLSLSTVAFNSEMMHANYLTFLEFVRCLSKRKKLSDGGSIVAVSSVASVKGLKSKIAYSASKAALDASVRNLAAELSEKKIRVNSIQKGWVSSDMQKDFIQSNQSISQDDDFKRQLLGVIEPDEIANTTVFLLSDAAPSLTGTSVLLDGGYTL